MGYGLYTVENVSKHSLYIVKVRSVILTTKTKYQEVQIIELEEYGRALILDGYIQSAEADEFIYHESLVHPVMVTHPNPSRVLIIGGGEGATLREVLKHNCVKEAVMVDIDGELVEFAKKYLDFMHQDAFYDPRAKIVIEDGKKYVAECSNSTFDVVIIDLTDPYSSEIAKSLYTREFYAEVKRILKNDGIMVTQAGNSFFYSDVYLYVLSNVKSVFPIVREYWQWVPSFGYACNFIVGSLKYDPAAVSEDKVDSVLRERGVKTKIFSGAHHISLLKGPVVYGRSAM
ncbi:MAG: polyamine aminopropyltransferase [Desulfurococcales archaeon]|nr:polyamine aminopropyltransferase [Desulfurococcales archaeon]